MHAVSVRSYSRNSGRTALEIVTGKPGMQLLDEVGDLLLVARR